MRKKGKNMKPTEDKKLLELAAKAAGYIIESHTEDGAWVYMKDEPLNKYDAPDVILWRPRADDGDALRLAVKLKIEPHFVGDSIHAITLQGSDIGEWEQVLAEELQGNDPYAATRRAITRAAAVVGRTMP